MKIGDLALQAGCDAQTIRYYEREGLLPSPQRAPSGYRRYARGHLERLNFIRHCRSLDLPLAQVRQLLELAAQPGRACAEADALLDRHIAQVRRRLQELQALERQLVALRRQCDGDTAHGCAILQAFAHGPAEQACACHGTAYAGDAGAARGSAPA